MKKQFVIIGLSSFGRRMLIALSSLDCEIMIIDRNKEKIEQLKNKATSAYITDVMNQESLLKIIPDNIDAAIVDLGDQIEVSILVTNYLTKKKIRKILVKAESDEHGEILHLVGATQVVFPDREAAKRIVPPLVSSSLYNFLPLSENLVIAEAVIPERFVGKTLIEANIRKDYDINIIALRKEMELEYSYFSSDYRLQDNDVLLVASTEDNLANFVGMQAQPQKGKIASAFKKILGE